MVQRYYVFAIEVVNVNISDVLNFNQPKACGPFKDPTKYK
jgi:hypothetical protein